MEIAALANLIAAGALSVAAVGLVFTGIQIRYTAKVQRATFFKETYEKLLSDTSIRYAYDLFEGGKPISAANFETEQTEFYKRFVAIESLFAHLQVICSLYYRGLFTKEDMADLRYAIERIARHPDFFQYEVQLREWAKSKKVSRGPYDNVFRYVKEELGIVLASATMTLSSGRK